VNLALLVWMVLSLPDCITIVLLKLGYLDTLVPSAEEREKMDEASTQVVNALFFLTCLIVFPLLCRHTFLLWRWGPKDKLELQRGLLQARQAQAARLDPHRHRGLLGPGQKESAVLFAIGTVHVGCTENAKMRRTGPAQPSPFFWGHARLDCVVVSTLQ